MTTRRAGFSLPRARLLFRITAGALLLAGLLFPERNAAASDPDVWTRTTQVGTTAVAAHNVLPLPLSVGVGVVVEKGWLGIEGAMHLDAATHCDEGSASASFCAPLIIWDAGPRFTAMPDEAWSPYASARIQLTLSRPHRLVPAAGPRLGLRYRGKWLGGYLEAGPSFVSAEDGDPGEFVDSGRWFPQASAGLSFPPR